MNDEGHHLVDSGDFNSEYNKLNDWMLNLGLVDVLAKNMANVLSRTNAPLVTPLIVSLQTPFHQWGKAVAFPSADWSAITEVRG